MPRTAELESFLNKPNSVPLLHPKVVSAEPSRGSLHKHESHDDYDMIMNSK